ncbi:flagellar hook-basal body complex protein FliE [Nitratireductor basaltis]|uniref:Flagellar hook-basal body complex protein FliE n=1 Tax=Nitratireductor basaltis TaxID=472175 RepID=A0A084U8A9_9HYPH|nr:flagellar hook-basal body complex protein FliE [Nitratireductor basaltis]KFB09195.1 Flagellar hook-basal body complex protein FliE [Nitratireductor basaltis]
MISGIGELGRLTSLGQNSLDDSQPSQATAPAGEAFSTMLSNFATSTVSKLEGAELMSVKAIQGEADTREVVDAVMSAEQSLQAAIAIRDKIVTAYLEVSRMAI